MTTVTSPSSVSLRSYSMFRRTSVVITTMGASPLIVLSPVSSPTLAAPRRATRSPNFWFDNAFSGVV
jgi:hypothetical protein